MTHVETKDLWNKTNTFVKDVILDAQRFNFLEEFFSILKWYSIKDAEKYLKIQIEDVDRKEKSWKNDVFQICYSMWLDIHEPKQVTELLLPC